MRSRPVGYGLAMLALCGVSALAAPSCADQEAAFYVVTPLVTEMDCKSFVVTCKTDQNPIANIATCRLCDGTVVKSSFACFLVASELAAVQPNGIATKNERRTIIVSGADVTLDGISKNEFLPAGGSIAPQTSGAPTNQPLIFSLVSSAAVDALYQADGTVNSTMVVHGRTTGGQDLVTPPYHFATWITEKPADACK